MNHITQEQAWVFACNFLPTEAAQALGPAEAQVICNAAIEWHIAQQAASVDATFKKWNAEKAEPIYYMRDDHTFKKLSEDIPTALVEIEAQLNAGYTSGMLCSKRDGFENIHSHHKECMKFLFACKERLEAIAQAAPKEPNAKLAEYEDQRIADSLSQPDVSQILEQLANEPPISGNHMAQARILLAADMYKKSPKTNTSQERVKKSEEFKQMLEAAYLAGFNESGEGYNGEYGANTAHPAWIKDRDNTLASITTGGTV